MHFDQEINVETQDGSFDGHQLWRCCDDNDFIIGWFEWGERRGESHNEESPLVRLQRLKDEGEYVYNSRREYNYSADELLKIAGFLKKLNS